MSNPGSGQAGLYRRVWRWHFFAGLLCLPFIFMLALTGAVYLFNGEIDDVLYADLLLRPASASSQTTTTPNRLLEQALRMAPGTPRALHWPRDSRHTVQVDVQQAGGVRQVFLDPPSGNALGSMAEADRIMPLIKRIHSLSVAGTAGNAVIEIVAGWVIVLVASGTYLWWPRGRRAGVLRIRPGATGRNWWRDLHAVTGAFAGMAVLFLALTGMPWSLVWGKQVNSWMSAHGLGAPHGIWNNLPRSTVPSTTLGAVSWSLEQQPLPASSVPGAGHEAHGDHGAHHGQAAPSVGASSAVAPAAIGIDRAVALFAAAGLADGYRLSLPRGSDGVYSALRARSDTVNQRVIHLDQYSGKVLMDLGPADAGAGARVFDWGVSVHQGIEYGALNQLVMLLGCLALMLLCVSSVVMWWQRRPAGQLAAPARKDGDRLAIGVIAIALVLGLVFPLLGASMLAAAAVDTLWQLRSARLPKMGAS